jgi:hypothetical protein
VALRRPLPLVAAGEVGHCGNTLGQCGSRLPTGRHALTGGGSKRGRSNLPRVISARVNAAFEANGDLALRVLWQPTSTQIQTPQLRFLWDYWTKLKGDARLPASPLVIVIASHHGMLVSDLRCAELEAMLDGLDPRTELAHRFAL